jgi:hypothetical protein
MDLSGNDYRPEATLEGERDQEFDRRFEDASLSLLPVLPLGQ